jgi:hypothetical protein
MRSLMNKQRNANGISGRLFSFLLKETNGVRRDNLQAKAFGGGSLLETVTDGDNFFCVGDVNARFIQEFLANEGIPLVTADLGGNAGRVIHFCFDDFSVYVRKIQKTINLRLIDEERHFWKNSIEKQNRRSRHPRSICGSSYGWFEAAMPPSGRFLPGRCRAVGWVFMQFSSAGPVFCAPRHNLAGKD